MNLITHFKIIKKITPKIITRCSKKGFIEGRREKRSRGGPKKNAYFTNTLSPNIKKSCKIATPNEIQKFFYS